MLQLSTSVSRLLVVELVEVAAQQRIPVAPQLPVAGFLAVAVAVAAVSVD
jgi:hypothetical protein